jgi:hypothetical protein
LPEKDIVEKSPSVVILKRFSFQKFRKLSSSDSLDVTESPGIGIARRPVIAGVIFGRRRAEGAGDGLAITDSPPTSWRSFVT